MVDFGRQWVSAGRRTIGFALVVACLSLGTLVATDEAAAGDWSVDSGDERQQRIIERYRAMLEENPVEGMALNRLLGYVGRGAGLNAMISQYEDRVEASPDRVNLRLVLGHLLKARGDNAEAFTHYDRAVELAPDNSQGWLSRGTVHLLLGDRREAMADFEEALERESNRERRHDIMRELGELSFGQRDFERGMEFFDRLLASNPRDQYIRMDYVRLLVQYRQFEEAIEQYDALRPLVAGDTRQLAILLRDKADVYEMKGDHDAALEAYEEAKSMVRSDSWLAREVRNEMVNVFRGAGRLADFIEDYGPRWSRGDVAQQTMVADVYAELGRLEEALEMYEQLARRDQRAVEPREKVIRILERLGRDDEIPAAHRDLMRAAPSDERHAFRLAEFYMRNGDRDNALDVLQDIARRFSNNSYVLLDLADRYADWNFHTEAHELYDLVLQREGDDDAVLIQVGDFYFDRGDRSRAIEIWERLPESQLGQREGSRRMAELMVQRGIMGEGIAAFDRLIEESPEDERMLRAMARALERAGRWDDALQRWFQLKELSQEPRREREARSRIVEIYERNQELPARLRQWSQAFDEEEAQEAIDAGFFLAEAKYRERDYQGAEEVLLRLQQREGLSEEQQLLALLILERTYVQNDRFADAIEVLSQLKERQPRQREELLNRMADYALEGGLNEGAVEYALRAVESNPDNARAQSKLGDVYRDIGDMESAAGHYQTATDIDPRDHNARLRLAQALEALGRTEEAEDAYMEVVREATENQLIRDAGDRMLVLAHRRGRLDALETQWAPLVFRMPIRDAHAQLMFNLYDRIAGPLLLAVHHGAGAARLQAGQDLRDLGGRAAPLLVEQLQRDDSAARARALRMVAEMHVDLASPQVARLIGDDDERVQQMAIVVAARIGQQRFVEPLQRALEDGSATVRHLATWGLGFIDRDEARQILVEIADTDVDGTGPRLAVLGLSSNPGPSLQQVLGGELQRLLDDPRGIDRDRAALLLTVAANAVAHGEGEEFRPVVTEMAHQRRDRVGSWAAHLLGSYGDEEAAAQAWQLALSGDSTLARRGEHALAELLGERAPMTRAWGEEVRFFDWTDTGFEAEALLQRTSQRWTHSRPNEGPEAWNDRVEAGLLKVLEDPDGAAAVGNALKRIGAQLRDGGRAPSFWQRPRAESFAEIIIRRNGHQSLSERDRLALEILETGSVEFESDVLDGEDGPLMAILEAVAIAGANLDSRLVEPLIAEAMGRSDPRVRGAALASLKGVSNETVSPEMSTLVVDALQDGDRYVQLAAVRASGHLALSDARETFQGLERDARPALRRAVRQARRALPEQ